MTSISGIVDYKQWKNLQSVNTGGKPVSTKTSISSENDTYVSSSKEICTDGKDDGKISFTEKLKNFGKGLIAPITNMFKSPKNFLIGAATIAAGAGLIALTGGAAAPIFIAAGVTLGTVQIGKGIYKASTAETDAEAKEAWQGIGTGTFSVAASVAGAKSAAKAGGIQGSENMNAFQAVKACFKNVPSAIKNSWTNATSNIGNLVSTKLSIEKQPLEKNANNGIQNADNNTKNIVDMSEEEYNSMLRKLMQEDKVLQETYPQTDYGSYHYKWVQEWNKLRYGTPNEETALTIRPNATASTPSTPVNSTPTAQALQSGSESVSLPKSIVEQAQNALEALQKQANPSRSDLRTALDMFDPLKNKSNISDITEWRLFNEIYGKMIKIYKNSKSAA